MANVGARLERTPLDGYVDFTMMYVAHDAFSRDLRRLAVASKQGDTVNAQALAVWTMFKKQLHTHHAAEDTSLWPKLRAAVSAPEDLAVLDAMEAEHAQIDPQLDRIDVVISANDTTGLAEAVHTLAAGLAAHMRHEEAEALPLVERHLGHAGWAAFGRQIRKEQGGIRGGAEYLPWVLDEASDATKTRVLRLLPIPARVLYRRVWAPRSRRTAGPPPVGA